MGRRGPRPGWARHVANGGIGPGQEAAGLGQGFRLLPKLPVACIVGLRGGMKQGQAGERLLRTAGVKVGGVSLEVPPGLAELGLRVASDVLCGLAEKVPLAQVEAERFVTGRVVLGRSQAQVRFEMIAKRSEGQGGTLRRRLEGGKRDPLLRGQKTHALREEGQGTRAFANRSLRPGQGRPPDVVARLPQKGGDRFHPCHGRPHALGERRELGEEERHHPEDGLARVGARVPAMEVLRSILEELSAQEASGQAHVEALGGGRRLQVQILGVAEEPFHFGQGVAGRALPEVREQGGPGRARR